ncbi:hypothetical protein HD554DRAFT_2042303 [Boletus coccyginus]|nr:hypothetical protein HD554DRAFT_2042303 [Boletus coccyginus]
MDGNFKAKHLHEKCPEDQVWLMDGLGYMVGWSDYQEYLKLTIHPMEASLIPKAICLKEFIGVTQCSNCNNHWAVNQANSSWDYLESTGIRAMACARHGYFIPHSVVDFQKGKRWNKSEQVNMDYSVTNTLSLNMRKINQVGLGGQRDYQNLVVLTKYRVWISLGHVSFTSPEAIGLSAQTLGRKLKVARDSSASASAFFNSLNSEIRDKEGSKWKETEMNALRKHVNDLSTMDIFELKLAKDPLNMGRHPTVILMIY